MATKSSGVPDEAVSPPGVETSEDRPPAKHNGSTPNEKADPKEELNEDVDDEVILTFPQKLMEILDDETTNDIISWVPHGRAFMIYKKNRFALQVLPRHFKKSKFSSFTRKLNRWGFTRVSRGPEAGAYYHKLFQRGDHRSLLQMSCQTKPLPDTALPRQLFTTSPFASLPPTSLDVTNVQLAESNARIQQQLNQLQTLQVQLAQQQQLHQLRQLEAAATTSAYLELLQSKTADMLSSSTSAALLGAGDPLLTLGASSSMLPRSINVARASEVLAAAELANLHSTGAETNSSRKRVKRASAA